jgi:hypothetical protein
VSKMPYRFVFPKGTKSYVSALFGLLTVDELNRAKSPEEAARIMDAAMEKYRQQNPDVQLVLPKELKAALEGGP